MSQATAPQTTFASGRYSKRKRTQVNYRMEEMDVDETENELEEEAVKPKVRGLFPRHAINTELISETAENCSIQTSSEAKDLSIPRVACRNP